MQSNLALRVDNEDNVIEFPRYPNLAKAARRIDNNNKEVWVICWCDDREANEKEEERKWHPVACRSSEEAARDYCREREGKEYRIIWGYKKLTVDRDEEE